MVRTSAFGTVEEGPDGGVESGAEHDVVEAGACVVGDEVEMVEGRFVGWLVGEEAGGEVEFAGCVWEGGGEGEEGEEEGEDGGMHFDH